MHLSKTKREALRQQFNGCCAYCGETLPVQGWHAEAISTELVEGGVIPVCTTCRQIKGNASLEEFRALLAEQVGKALRHSVNFRAAMRFGLVSQQAKQVEFWFQKCAASREDSAHGPTDTADSSHSYAGYPCQALTEITGNSL